MARGTGGGAVCMLLYLPSHVWNSWTHRSSLPIKATPWKHSVARNFAIFAAIPRCAALRHSQLFVMRPCVVFIGVSVQTHLWTWCTTERGPCRPDEGGEGRTAERWRRPWTVSPVSLGSRCSRCHGRGGVLLACHRPSAGCCECTHRHLHGGEWEVCRRHRQGQVLGLKRVWVDKKLGQISQNSSCAADFKYHRRSCKKYTYVSHKAVTGTTSLVFEANVSVR